MSNYLGNYDNVYQRIKLRSPNTTVVIQSYRIQCASTNEPRIEK